MRVLVFAAALYLVAPGHPDVILSGVPLGQTGTFLLIALLVFSTWTRDTAVPVRPSLIRALGIAAALKVAMALVVPHSGWIASYYANDQLQPPLRKSTEFSIPGATRIDRQLSFVDTEFPVHFFNDDGFNFGVRREASEAFSVEWQGRVHARAPLSIRHDARGQLQVTVDGVVASTNPIAIEPGNHLIVVQYRKPKTIEGAVHVQPLDAGGAPREWAIGEVTPIDVAPSRRAAARYLANVAWTMHLLAAVVLIAGLRPALVAKVRQLRARHWVDAARECVMPVVILGLALQGLWKSRHLVDRVFTLSGGDDWWAFEMNARDTVFSGWLIPRGALGQGLPYFEYPGYGYFVAGAHWLTGESLAGVILINFVCLAVATVLVHAIARRLTNELAALCAVVWLLALEQMDFVRYYTVTLLSENLFFLLVALTVFMFVRFVQSGGWWTLMMGAFSGGFAAATRPTILLFLPVALILLPLARVRPDGFRRAALVPVLVVICWLAAIAPFTYRNYVVSGKPVLITEGQSRTFIVYNLPPDNPGNVKYLEGFRESNLAAAIILLRILWDHPIATLHNWGTKAGFGLGMVHWMGSSGTPHPELVITSAFYLASILLLRDARRLAAWLVHGFVFTHLATLLLTMPSNYGYRMVLPMYLLMVVFAGALVVKLTGPWLHRRFSTEPTPA
jgi:hypothetical protein